MNMSVEFFIFAFVVVSAFTSLLTEAVKMVCEVKKWNYHANILAGWCAIFTSICVSVLYMLYTGTKISAHAIVFVIVLIIMSWIGAMVGYDKVIQTITQVKTYKTIKKEDE